MSVAYHPHLSRNVRFEKMAYLRHVVLRTLVFLTMSMLFPLSVQLAGAQDIFGRISGTVTDQTGAAVPKAKVTKTNQETKIERTVQTDDAGFYVAPVLPVGTYKVSAEEKGFKTISKSGNDLSAGGRLTVNLTLQVGEASEKIEVSTNAETVNTISGEISRTIDSEQVQNMALNQRNYAQLVSLIPGAALTAFDQTAMTNRYVHYCLECQRPACRRKPFHRGRRLQHGLRLERNAAKQRWY